MAVSYEWCVEIVVRETGDIEDNNFVASFAEATAFVRSAAEDDEYDYRIVLVRTEGNEDDGVTGRLWAYVTADGTLPEFFANSYGTATGVKVPQKFRKETR